jgi:hypothetical protein
VKIRLAVTGWGEDLPLGSSQGQMQGGTGIGKKYMISILDVNETGNSISEGPENWAKY